MNTAVFHNETGTAAEIIRQGGLVAVPTETVYGLAGNGMDAAAVEQIYEVKERPAIKPLSLMVPSREAIPEYTLDAPQDAYALAETFWPGPLTIVLRAKPEIPSIVLAGGSTVGLRCPDAPLTLKLLEEAGVPFAAPSANPSGESSPKCAEDVLSYFDGKIDAVIDGGRCALGFESTIIDMTSLPYRILRQGFLPAEEIADKLVEHMTVIGVTGCTGAGKTSALDVLAENGALVIDCDAVYHDLLDSSEEMLAALQNAFPQAFTDGVLDRKALGNLVFSDASALSRLNALTHGFVADQVTALLREHAMAGGKLAAIDAIELLSSGIAQLCDCTVAVVAEEEIRAERIMKRDGISREYALKRIHAQKDETYYREHCTYTVENNTDICDFTDKILNILDEVKKNG